MIAPDNSRMGKILPDVAAVDAPVVRAMLAATDRFGAGDLEVAAFQSAILALLRADPPWLALAHWVDAARAERADQVLSRRDLGARDDTIQIIYVAPGEVHPCHCHHNVTSTQVVLTGEIHAREFDRIERVGADAMRLRLLFDGRMGPGDFLQASDGARNAHWFAAGDRPATLLNFNIRGYETATFYPLGTRPLGRRMLDATAPAEDGLILARVIPPVAAYERFGGRALAEFPMNVAAAEAQPRTLGAP